MKVTKRFFFHLRLQARQANKEQTDVRTDVCMVGKKECSLFLYFAFFGLFRPFMTALRSPIAVNVPPIKAHIDVINSYQCFPLFFICTAIGDKS